jgi:hypothetical protein
MFKFKIPIPTKKIAVLMAICVFGLIATHIFGQYYKNFVSNDGFLLKIIDKFDLDLEKNNLPTWYQSSTILLGACLLAVIAFVKKNKQERDVRYWAFLSLTFLFLSADEAVSIHEQMTMPLRNGFDLHGFLFLSWVIPAGIAVFILFAAYFKFLFRLPSATRWLLIAAGFVYLSGALGIEMINGNHLEANHFIATNPEIVGVTRFDYALLTALEEFLEMSGIAIFIYALVGQLNSELNLAPAKEAISDVAETKFSAPVLVKKVQTLDFDKGNYVQVGITDKRNRQPQLG